VIKYVPANHRIKPVLKSSVLLKTEQNHTFIASGTDSVMKKSDWTLSDLTGVIHDEFKCTTPDVYLYDQITTRNMVIYESNSLNTLQRSMAIGEVDIVLYETLEQQQTGSKMLTMGH
jgi:hypothetical protein